MFNLVSQGRRHEILIWGGGVRIYRHPNPPTPKIYFLLGFQAIILKMLENAKNISLKKKGTEISKFLGVDPHSFQCYVCSYYTMTLPLGLPYLTYKDTPPFSGESRRKVDVFSYLW